MNCFAGFVATVSMDYLADYSAVIEGENSVVVDEGIISTVAMFIDSTRGSIVPGFFAGCVQCRVLIGDLATANLVFN